MFYNFYGLLHFVVLAFQPLTTVDYPIYRALIHVICLLLILTCFIFVLKKQILVIDNQLINGINL